MEYEINRLRQKQDDIDLDFHQIQNTYKRKEEDLHEVMHQYRNGEEAIYVMSNGWQGSEAKQQIHTMQSGLEECFELIEKDRDRNEDMLQEEKQHYEKQKQSLEEELKELKKEDA